jgi:hypothetical protein
MAAAALQTGAGGSLAKSRSAWAAARSAARRGGFADCLLGELVQRRLARGLANARFGIVAEMMAHNIVFDRHQRRTAFRAEARAIEATDHGIDRDASSIERIDAPEEKAEAIYRQAGRRVR